MGFRYYELLQKTGSIYYLRQKIIDKLRENNGNIYKTAKQLSTSRNTVRKVWRAYRQRGLEALNGKKAGNPHPPKKISEVEEKRIVSEYQKVKIPTVSNFRLYYNSKYHCNLNLKVFYRVLKAHQLYKGLRKRKPHRKKEAAKLRKEVGMPLKFWQCDIKDLSDILKYFLQAKRLKLPLFQIGFKDVVSGAVFIFYAYCVGVNVLANTLLFFLWHLKRFRVPTQGLTIQTDNDSSIIGSWNKKELPIFTKIVNQFGSEHARIPPGTPYKNGYIESFHHICEMEFYDFESFQDTPDFYGKAMTWYLRYNIIRKSKALDGKAPLEVIKEHFEGLDERFFVSLPPLTFLGSEPVPQIIEKFYGNNLKDNTLLPFFQS